MLLLWVVQGTHHGPSTIEELLGEELGLHSFIDFLVNDYSVENILFYLDVEAFKRLKRKQDILSQANNIYNKYLTTEAELELASIDAEERKKLTYILANKTGKVKNNFFEALQKHIYSFLKVPLYPCACAVVRVRVCVCVKADWWVACRRMRSRDI